MYNIVLYGGLWQRRYWLTHRYGHEWHGEQNSLMINALIWLLHYNTLSMVYINAALRNLAIRGSSVSVSLIGSEPI